MTLSQIRTEIFRKFVFLMIFEKRLILRKMWICISNFFWSFQLKGININKKCFSPQCVPHSVKLCLSVVLKHFWENSQRTSLFSQKSDYLWKEHWNTQKVCFSYHVWKGQILIKNWVCLNNCFWSNQLKVININKNCFSKKVSHIVLNYAFQLLKHFWGNS